LVRVLDGPAQEADHVKEHLVVLQVVDVVGVMLTPVLVQQLQSGVVLLYPPLEPVDEVQGDRDVPFLIGHILVPIIALASLLLNRPSQGFNGRGLP
jgi:hypothetical protein